MNVEAEKTVYEVQQWRGYGFKDDPRWWMVGARVSSVQEAKEMLTRFSGVKGNPYSNYVPPEQFRILKHHTVTTVEILETAPATETSAKAPAAHGNRD